MPTIRVEETFEKECTVGDLCTDLGFPEHFKMVKVSIRGDTQELLEIEPTDVLVFVAKRTYTRGVA